MKKSFLKTQLTEVNSIVDMETGELIEQTTKKHSYIANSKEDFLLLYSSILGIFQRMEQSEIRVFSFLLQYANGTKFSVNKPIRLEISKQTNLNERTVYNTIKKLEDKKLIFKHETGAYQVNPRYAFKGSSLERNNQLKLIIELGCKDC